MSNYEKCPHRFYREYIAKDYPYPKEENYHFVKGKKIHSQLENYVKCKNDPTMINFMYDGIVQNAFPIIEGLISQGFELTAEQQLATDVNFQTSSWYGKNTAWRAIVDLTAIKDDKAIIIDHKSGKVRDYDGSKTGQLHLTAGIIFSVYPNINSLQTAYLFIEHKQTIIRQFTRKMYEEGLLDPFREMFKIVNKDKDFKAKRNQYCNWCDINTKGECPLD